MLVIPAIDLKHGRCVCSRPSGAQKPTGYYDDPVRMAKLWRVLNAKVLHLMDLDGLLHVGEMDRATRERIEAVCDAVDIPVQVRGGIRTLQEIDDVLSLGVYRVIVGSAISLDDRLLSEAIQQFSSSKIVVTVEIRAGKVVYEDAIFAPERDPESFVQQLEESGCRRIFLVDMDGAGTMRGVDFDLVKAVAGAVSKMKITVSGGIGGYEDLAALKKLGWMGVDSAVVDRALYENAFPCQQFWCWHDIEDVDLETFTTAQLRS
ncbi:MAG: HisA/HisF-related TIM barrel protein [Rhodothermia bacterium]